MCDGTVNGFFILLWKEFLTMKVVYQTCLVSMSTNLFSLPQSLKLLPVWNLRIKRSVSPPLTILFCNSKNGLLKQFLLYGLIEPLICAWKMGLTLISMLSKTKKVFTTPLPVLCSVASSRTILSITWRIERLSLLFVPPTWRRNGD